MADKYYGMSIGMRQPHEVTESGSTTGLPIEVRINDSVYAESKILIDHALQAIRQYIHHKEGSPIS